MYIDVNDVCVHFHRRVYHVARVPRFARKCIRVMRARVFPESPGNYPDARCIRVTGYQYLQFKPVASPWKVCLQCPTDSVSRPRADCAPENYHDKYRDKNLKGHITREKTHFRERVQSRSSPRSRGITLSSKYVIVTRARRYISAQRESIETRALDTSGQFILYLDVSRKT